MTGKEGGFLASARITPASLGRPQTPIPARNLPYDALTITGRIRSGNPLRMMIKVTGAGTSAGDFDTLFGRLHKFCSEVLNESHSHAGCFAHIQSRYLRATPRVAR